MMLSCLLFHGLILCNFDSYFAYLLFASLGLFMFSLSVCLFLLSCLLTVVFTVLIYYTTINLLTYLLERHTRSAALFVVVIS